MQPHTLCPLDCEYCDLPLRRVNKRMSVDVARAVAQTVNVWTDQAEEQGRRQPNVLWHSSEPLALGVNHLAALYEPFADDVMHTLQTAGIHIDDAWAEFFKATRTGVGVSLDGPEHMNRHRKLLGGQAAFGRTMRGIEVLHRHQIPFAIIAVVYDPQPQMVQELMRFFGEQVRPTTLAINIAETQGNKVAPPLDYHTTVRFWEEVIIQSAKYSDMAIRDVERVMDFIGRLHMDDWDTSAQDVAHPKSRDPYPTVRYDGNVVLVAPELVDWLPDGREEWTSGNVLKTGLQQIIDDAAAGRTTAWIQDFLTGVDNCAAECPAFGMCHGGQPSNRVFENMPLTTTRTRTCINDRIALMEGTINAFTNRDRSDAPVA